MNSGLLIAEEKKDDNLTVSNLGAEILILQEVQHNDLAKEINALRKQLSCGKE